MTESIPTKERLALALEALGDRKLKHVIRAARAGYYDDFESPLTFPETELYNEMKARGYNMFCQRIANGEFDSTEEESSRWANSIDGLETFDDPKIRQMAYALMSKICHEKGLSKEEFDKEWLEFVSKGGLTE